MKSTTKIIIFVIVAIMVAGVLLVALGHVSDGFQNLSPSDWAKVNENNLYQSFEFMDVDGVFANGANGVVAELKDDNVVKASGKAEDALAIEIGTYTLKSGKSYVFDGSLNDGSKGTAYLALVKADGSEIAASYVGAVVISVDKVATDTPVTLVLKIAAEEKVNLTLKPILCEGNAADDVVSFYK